MVFLDPDVAEVFTDSAAVNQALRQLVKLAKAQVSTTTRPSKALPTDEPRATQSQAAEPIPPASRLSAERCRPTRRKSPASTLRSETRSSNAPREHRLRPVESVALPRCPGQYRNDLAASTM